MCLTLSAMQKLYKIASHPSLLQVDHCETGKDAKNKLAFAKVALTPDILRELPGGTYYKSEGILDDHVKLSGKMKTLDYLLKRYLRRSNRVLLFSYSTASLDFIQNHVKVRCLVVRLPSSNTSLTHQIFILSATADPGLELPSPGRPDAAAPAAKLGGQISTGQNPNLPHQHEGRWPRAQSH